MGKFLVKATIPAVQDLILQFRKLSDLYGGSNLIPEVLRKTIKSVKDDRIKLLIPSERYLNTDNMTNEDEEEGVKSFGN
ncbi:MAG: hypothetical protein N2Z80_04575 [Hydrogenothermaceae bacterium]|nr:hypothetical protein [Hydrogenothermaceae bacterium]